MNIEELAKSMREKALEDVPESIRRVEELKALHARIRRKEATDAERQREEENKLYFNAGRYSGGARDKNAIEAWRRLGHVL
jgi:hypothetical protein